MFLPSRHELSPTRRSRPVAPARPAHNSSAALPATFLPVFEFLYPALEFTNEGILGFGHTAPTGLLLLQPDFCRAEVPRPNAGANPGRSGPRQGPGPSACAPPFPIQPQATTGRGGDFLHPALKPIGVRGIPAVPAITDQGTRQKAHPIPQTQPEPHGIVHRQSPGLGQIRPVR